MEISRSHISEAAIYVGCYTIWPYSMHYVIHHLRSMDQNFVGVGTIGEDIQQIRLRYEVVAWKLPPSPIQEVGETFFAEVQLLLNGL